MLAMTGKYLLITVISLSCGTGIKISKSDLKPISSNSSGTFQNHPYRTLAKSYLEREKLPPQTLLNHFHIFMDADTVHLEFNSNQQLVLSYKDSIATRTLTFNGKFSKKGYYEIIFCKKKIEIPPVIPVLFSRREIDSVDFAKISSA
jgi:hypothetical protein